MRMLSVVPIAISVALLMAAVPVQSATTKEVQFNLLHSFAMSGDGYYPSGSLLKVGSGKFYGMTIKGGVAGRSSYGTIYELKKKNRYRVWGLDQNAVVGPYGALIADTLGNLYGTTQSGSVFEFYETVGQNGHTRRGFKTLYSLPQGSLPSAGLAHAGQASGVYYDGTSPLYGTTNAGGAEGAGSLFELKQSGGQWTATVLHDFCSDSNCADGRWPMRELTVDGEGNIFGTAPYGGKTIDAAPNGAGVAFRLSPNGDGTWAYTVIHTFCSAKKCVDGAVPMGSLIIDPAGDLIGTAAGGGKCHAFDYGCGAVFKLHWDGSEYQETILHNFCTKENCTDGYEPMGGVALDESGNLLGTTAYGGANTVDYYKRGGGTIFKLNATSFKILYSFCSLADCQDGEYPAASLVLDNHNSLYGTTPGDPPGDGGDTGTAFELQY